MSTKLLSGIFFVILTFLLCIWPFIYNHYASMLLFFPNIILLTALFVLVEALISRRWHTKYKTALSLFIRFRYFIPLIAFVFALFIKLAVFGGIPHIQDSIHYQMIAQWISRGHLSIPIPESYEFYRYIYFLQAHDSFVSLFFPGYSLFLAPFVALHIWWLANPLLLAAVIALTGMTAERAGGKTLSALTMLFAVFSPFFLIMGGTGMAHPFTALLTVGASLLVLDALYFSRLSPLRALLLGTAIGWLAVSRLQNAVFLVAAFAPFIIAFYMRNKNKKQILIYTATTIIATLPWGIGMALYNNYFTGSPLMFIQDIYFNYSEPTLFCHRLGLGHGCFKSNWNALPEEGLTVAHAFWVTWKRLTALAMSFLNHPIVLFFVPVAFLPFTHKKNRILFFLATPFIVAVIGYFFFFFDANVFGARYYYETALLLLIVLAEGVLRIRTFRLHPVIKHSIFALFPSLFIFYAATIMPTLLEHYHRGFWDVDSSVATLVHDAGIHHAVVFISPPRNYGSGLAVMDTSNIEHNDIIYARDLGKESNMALMTRLPDRTFYRLTWPKGIYSEVKPVLKKVDKKTDNNHIFVEMENKGLPLKCRPDYCNYFPDKALLNRFLPMEPPYDQTFSDHAAWYCKVKEGQCYDFGQYIPAEGRWKVIFTSLDGPAMSNFHLAVDGKIVSTITMHANEFHLTYHETTVRLSKGFHFFTFTPDLSNDENPVPFFMIDYIEFDRK